MPSLSGRHKLNLVHFWRAALLSWLPIALAVLSPLSVARAADCPGFSSATHTNEARSCYIQHQRREGELFRIVDHLPGAEEKISEIKRYVAEVDSLSVPVRKRLLNLLTDAKRFEAAKKEMRAIEELDRGHFPPLARAEQLMKLSDHAAAEKELSSILKTQPENLAARQLRAVSSYELRDYAQAVEDLRILTAADYGNYSFDLALAKALLKKGDRKEASERIVRLAQQPSPAADLSQELAEIAESLGRHEAAEAAYRDSFHREYGREAGLGLSRVLGIRGSADEAHQALLETFSRFPGDEEMQRSVVDSYLERGQIAAAGKLLEDLAGRSSPGKWVMPRLAALRSRFGTSVRSSSRMVASEAPMKSEKPQESQEWETIRVRSGDSLMGISHKIFGTHQKWKIIFRMNEDRLKTPAGIRPGMRLKVPKKREGSGE